MTDRQLLQAYASEGDLGALTELILRHREAVLRTCRRHLVRHSDIEDVTQDVFVALIEKADEVDSNVGGWLHGCAVRKCAFLIRSRQNRRRREMCKSLDGANPACDELDVEHQGILRQCLEQMENPDRELLEQYVIHEKTQHVLAMRLGITQQAVAKRIRKALDKLRRMLVNRGAGLSVLAIRLEWKLWTAQSTVWSSAQNCMDRLGGGSALTTAVETPGGSQTVAKAAMIILGLSAALAGHGEIARVSPAHEQSRFCAVAAHEERHQGAMETVQAEGVPGSCEGTAQSTSVRSGSAGMSAPSAATRKYSTRSEGTSPGSARLVLDRTTISRRDYASKAGAQQYRSTESTQHRQGPIDGTMSRATLAASGSEETDEEDDVKEASGGFQDADEAGPRKTRDTPPRPQWPEGDTMRYRAQAAPTFRLPWSRQDEADSQLREVNTSTSRYAGVAPRVAPLWDTNWPEERPSAEWLSSGTVNKTEPWVMNGSAAMISYTSDADPTGDRSSIRPYVGAWQWEASSPLDQSNYRPSTTAAWGDETDADVFDARAMRMKALTVVMPTVLALSPPASPHMYQTKIVGMPSDPSLWALTPPTSFDGVQATLGDLADARNARTVLLDVSDAPASRGNEDGIANTASGEDFLEPFPTVMMEQTRYELVPGEQPESIATWDAPSQREDIGMEWGVSASVPEPATLALVGSGACWLSVIMRRRYREGGR